MDKIEQYCYRAMNILSKPKPVKYYGQRLPRTSYFLPFRMSVSSCSPLPVRSLYFEYEGGLLVTLIL